MQADDVGQVAHTDFQYAPGQLPPEFIPQSQQPSQSQQQSQSQSQSQAGQAEYSAQQEYYGQSQEYYAYNNEGGGGWEQTDAASYDDDGGPQGIPLQQPNDDGPCVTVPALSFRQPFASLVLYGVKQLEARNRPQLKQTIGPLALHISHKEEPFGSPLVNTAVGLLRRRYPDSTISQLFALPQAHAEGFGCIVGLVDVEATWPADLFNEVEQQQLTEQAVFPVGGTFITQLRNPRWLKYPVRTSGSNRLWHVQLPIDCLPEGTELDAQGKVMCAYPKDRPPLYQPGTHAHVNANVLDGDEQLAAGLLGGDMVRTLGTSDALSEKEKKEKKLLKALRQIEEIKAKQAAGLPLEKTQIEKVAREPDLRAELAALTGEGAEEEAPQEPPEPPSSLIAAPAPTEEPAATAEQAAEQALKED